MAERDTLGKIQAVATIISTIAIPLVIAYFGWKVEEELSKQSVNKDYVEMALRILQENREEADKRLTRWATSIVDENSPMPLSTEARIKYEVGDLMIAQLAFPEPPDILMEPPEPPIPLGTEGSVTMEELLINVAGNYKVCRINDARLEHLQKWIKAMKDIYNKPSQTTKIIDVD